MSDRERKQTALQELAQLDTTILERLAELSRNRRARAFFSNSLQFAMLKGYLNNM